MISEPLTGIFLSIWAKIIFENVKQLYWHQTFSVLNSKHQYFHFFLHGLMYMWKKWNCLCFELRHLKFDASKYLSTYMIQTIYGQVLQEIYIHLLKKLPNCAKNLDSKLFRSCSYPQLLGLLITAQRVGYQAGRGTVLFFCCFQSHLLLLPSDALLLTRFWNSLFLC